MHKITLATLLLALVAGGCAGANPPLETSDPPLARSAASPQPASFTAWRDAFRGRALAQGIQPQVFDAAFQGVGVNAEVVRLDSRQAEFTKPIWEYLDSAASPTRVATGRAKRAQLDPTLAAIERRYGVDRQAVLAIWGMEFELRRLPRRHPGDREPGDARLRGPPPLLRRGAADRRAADHPGRRHRARAACVGSWAGAMGHTQFIPTSYLSLRRRLHRRRPPRRLVRRPDRRARLRRQLPRQRPAGSAAGPGASRCACPTASTTAAPTSRTAARSPTGAPAA